MTLKIHQLNRDSIHRIVSYIISRDDKTRLFLLCDFIGDLSHSDFDLLKSEMDVNNRYDIENVILYMAKAMNKSLLVHSEDIYKILVELACGMNEVSLDAWLRAIAKYEQDCQSSEYINRIN